MHWPPGSTSWFYPSQMMSSRRNWYLWLFCYLCQGGYILPSISHSFVYLFVCQQLEIKTTDRIFMKILSEIISLDKEVTFVLEVTWIWIHDFLNGMFTTVVKDILRTGGYGLSSICLMVTILYDQLPCLRSQCARFIELFHATNALKLFCQMQWVWWLLHHAWPTAN